MTEELQLDLGSNPDWQAEHLRLTCFVQGAPLTQFQWWEHICTHGPDSSTIRMQGAHKLEEGKFGLGILSFEVQPGRMDMVLRPLINEQNPLPGLPILGAFPKALMEFEVLAKKLFMLESLPPVQRLAFGVPAFMPVNSLETGYRALANFLPALEVDFEHSSDLSYQINRPRKAKTNFQSLTINRLSRWSVARLRVYASQTEEVRTLAVEQYACRLELDINTVPENRDPLAKDKLLDLFSELTSLASEIMLKGDIA